MEDDVQTEVQAEGVAEYPTAQPLERLKAERVQLGEPALDRLKAERVQEELAAAPARRLEGEPLMQLMQDMSGWRLSADGRAILRRFKFPTLRAAMAFAAFGAELTAAHSHQPGVNLHGNDVIVTYSTASVFGLTPLDFSAARALSLHAVEP
jgi:pterin-4a-carbinolamine dehydratase